MKKSFTILKSYISYLLIFAIFMTSFSYSTAHASPKNEKLNFISLDDTRHLEDAGINLDGNYTSNKVINCDGKKVDQLIYDDNLIIETDQNQIFSISHFVPSQESNTKIYNADDLKNSVDTIKSLSEIDSSYALTESSSFDEDYWGLRWTKKYGDLLNPYEGVTAVINRHTEDLVVYNYFDEKPNTLTPQIDYNTALESVSSFLDDAQVDISQIEYKLTFTKPIYAIDSNIDQSILNNVRLSYCFILPNGDSVYVDSTTGDIIDYSEIRATAKAFSVSGGNAFPNPKTQTSDATTCFKKLGYNTLSAYYSSGNMRTSILNFLKRSDAYGFYLACHGDKNQTVLSGNNNSWEIHRSDISGNWRFVFLDACYSANGTGWASCFNISNSSKNRAFLGWYKEVNGKYSTQFTSFFFPEVINRDHSDNIRDAAVWAAYKVKGEGTTPIRFYGDKTYNGRI